MTIFTSPQSLQHLKGAEGGRGWGKWGQSSPDSPGDSLSLFLPQVHPALSTKQCLEPGISHVLHGDNGQLSLVQHFAKAQSRDPLVQCTPVLTKQQHQSLCKPNHADHHSYSCKKKRPKAELKM